MIAETPDRARLPDLRGRPAHRPGRRPAVEQRHRERRAQHRPRLGDADRAALHPRRRWRRSRTGRFTIVGFSLGATIIRDALRRLHVEGAINPWERLDDVVLLAGANHGVSTYARLCGKNPTMRGQVACELGSRDSFAPTDFMSALNGPDGAYETPCADGDGAYGATGACGGNTVAYTTVVMRDIADGSYQDEFVSESSSALAGADNRLIELDDTDESGYFFNGLLKNHYGAARSQAALDIVVEVVGD